ncbi:MAG: YgcG family protein [Methylococcaceae bacterium]
MSDTDKMYFRQLDKKASKLGWLFASSCLTYCLKILGALLFLTSTEFNSAHAEQKIPQLISPVTDLTGTLSPSQKQGLEQKLLQFESSKGSQLVILIVPSTQPESIEQYAFRAAEQWKLGRKNIDDGVLLLVAKNDRKLRIEVGYGLEGAIPDAIAKRVISEIITPYFKAGDFYSGISAGTEQLTKLINGEPLPPPSQSYGNQQSTIEELLFILFFILFFAPILRSMFGRLIGSSLAGGFAGYFTWSVTTLLASSVAAGVAIFFLAMLFHRGGRSNFPSDRGGYGGGFGGSWSGRSGGFGGGFGGGGGGFGGGGASGGW